MQQDKIIAIRGLAVELIIAEAYSISEEISGKLRGFAGTANFRENPRTPEAAKGMRIGT